MTVNINKGKTQYFKFFQKEKVNFLSLNPKSREQQGEAEHRALQQDLFHLISGVSLL